LDLISHPEVDLVSVVVKVPDHYDLVMACIQAGKHVYCEWPLGRNSFEAETLSTAAQARGVKHMVGLQARMAPEIEHARELVAEGLLGDILSVTLITGTPGWGEVVDRGHLYILDKANGVTLLAVVGGHHCDTISHVLGGIRNVSATIANRRSRVRILESGTVNPQTSPDQVALTGELICGAPFVVQLRGGRAARSDLHLQILGTEGELLITSEGNVQMSALSLSGVRGGSAPVPISAKIDPDPIGGLAGTPAYNVAKLYRRLAHAIEGDHESHPTFADAVLNHHLLDAIEQAALTGVRQPIR
jgi:predicted dehydrogenase